MSNRIGNWMAVGVLLASSGAARAGDSETTAERVAAAREAYEAALAELQAAEAAFAAERAAGVATADAASDRVGSADLRLVQPEGQPAAEQPEPEKGFFDWDAWTKSVDLGLNGSSGNSENLNIRARLGMERKTSEMETTASLLYRLASSDGDKTENRFRFEVLNDWLPPEGSRIRWWAKGAYEYDEFQDWDSRVSGAAGIGYEIIDTEKHSLVGRLGFGGSQTYGGMDDEFRPEAVAGLDYVWSIKEGQAFKAGTELLLDVSDTENFRVNSYAQYEVLVDADTNMVFKTGVANRYDSEPGAGAKKSDLDYYATLGWTF